MNFCWKLSYPEKFQIVHVPAILEEQANVFVVLNSLCLQNVAAMDHDFPLVDFQTHSGTYFQEILHLC